MEQGSQFGPYTLIKRIAYGGMAEIHLAKTHGIGGFEKLLALKVIHPKYSEDQEFIDMLVDEAKMSVQLSHGNICQTYDLGRIDGTYYIAMEFIDGKDLYQLLVQCSELEIEIPFDVLAYITMETAAGLQYAHTKADNYGRPLDLIHRDISPQNILISYDGEVKIVDFGIAKASQRSRETESGVIKGKFFYMSPEQAWGDDIDARTDIFSTGICLYEMVTGEMLYNEEKALVLLDKVRKAEIPPMRQKRRDLPPSLEQVALKALARDRDERYRTAGALQGQLSAFLYGNVPDFSRDRVKAFMHRVFGDQRFVLPMPDPAAKKAVVNTQGSLMGRAKEEMASEHSVIYDLRQLDSAAQASTDDFSEDEHTVASPYAAGPASIVDDDDDDEMEMTVMEPVWTDAMPLPTPRAPAPTPARAPPAQEEEEDATAVIDMSSAASAVADEEPATHMFSRDGAIPPRLNRPVEPSAGRTAPGPVPRDPQPTPPATPSAGAVPRARPSRPSVPVPAISQPPAAAPAPVAARPPPNRAHEGDRGTVNVTSARVGPPARAKGGFLKTLLTPTGVTVLALLALLVYAGVTLIPTLTAEEAPKVATLVVRSAPTGAGVVLDGTDTGQRTPARIQNMAVGSSHQVGLRMKGFEPQEQAVTISEETAGQEMRLPLVYLKKSKGTLKVTSNPPGAEVYLDAKYVGDTPLTLQDLARDKNELRLVLRKDGFRDYPAVLTWNDEIELPLDVRLKRRGK